MFAAMYIQIKPMTVYRVEGVARLQCLADFCVPDAGGGGVFAVFCCGLRRVHAACVVALKIIYAAHGKRPKTWWYTLFDALWHAKFTVISGVR